MVSVTTKLARARNEDVVRFEGCPVSVSEQVLALVNLGKTKNPFFSTAEMLKFNKAYFGWRGRMLAKQIGGTPYQVKGACSRGEAAPDVGAEVEASPLPAE
jgi:hypothetical protein